MGRENNKDTIDTRKCCHCWGSKLKPLWKTSARQKKCWYCKAALWHSSATRWKWWNFENLQLQTKKFQSSKALAKLGPNWTLTTEKDKKNLVWVTLIPPLLQVLLRTFEGVCALAKLSLTAVYKKNKKTKQKTSRLSHSISNSFKGSYSTTSCKSMCGPLQNVVN